MNFPVMTLTEGDMFVSKCVGHAIVRFAATSGAVDRQFSSRDPVEIQVDGAGAEIAHHRLTGAPLNLVVTSGTPPGWDTLWRGWRLDVKCVSWKKADPWFKVDPDLARRHADCDGYAFFVSDRPYYQFRGYISRKGMMKCPVGTLGHGPFHKATQEDLVLELPPREAA